MQTEAGVRNYSTAYRRSVWDYFRSISADGRVLCSNCGHVTGKEAVEMDHNVALKDGGYDVISNIRPLCHACHMAKHRRENLSESHSELIKQGIAESDKKCGRPRSLPENYRDLLHDYVFCRISRDELSKRWGVMVQSRNDPSNMIPVDMVRLTGKVWYQDYLRELGIEKVVNKVGQHTREYCNKGIVGYIVYKTGEKKYIYETA